MLHEDGVFSILHFSVANPVNKTGCLPVVKCWRIEWDVTGSNCTDIGKNENAVFMFSTQPFYCGSKVCPGKTFTFPFVEKSMLNKPSIGKSNRHNNQSAIKILY